MKAVFTDDSIITNILGGGRSREQAIAYLYNESGIKDEVMKFIRSRSGSQEAAEDIFQEGMVSLVMNIQKGKFKGEGSIKGYLYGICRNIWFKKAKKENPGHDEWNPDQSDAPDLKTPEYHLFNQEKKNVILEVLGKLGEKCKQLLLLWRMSYSMKEIAERTDYKSEGVVRKKKHQCMKGLVAMVQENPELVKILKE